MSPDDVIVRTSGVGLQFSASKRLRQQFRRKSKQLQSLRLDDVTLDEDVMSVEEPEAVYSTLESYSRLGEYGLPSTVKNS